MPVVNRPRIALIIDNPTRDLDGLVLLGKNLVEKGADVFLIPMYSQGFEIPAIGPDIVVMNYARPVNAALIKAYSEAGILVAVLDTEGGVWESEEFFVNSISHKECAKYIDLYCVWGRAQLAAMEKHTNFKKDQLAITGCPRFDFYSAKFRSKMHSSYPHLKSYVLVISNFALASPRYGTSDKEILNMIEYGFSREYAESKLADELRSRKELVEVIKNIAQKFKNIDFIIRAHPFEDDSQYHIEFSSYANVKVLRDGVVGPWIRDAKLILHLNSSVAVDAYMIGHIALSLDWINSDLSRNLSAISYDLSHKVKSKDELMDWLEKTNTQTKPVVSKSQIDPKSEILLESLFGPNDGKSAERLSQALFSLLEKRQKKPDLKRCRQIAVYGSRSASSWKGWVEGFCRLILGARTTERIKSLRAPHRETKQLSLQKAQLILDSLLEQKIQSAKVQKLKSDQLIIPRIASDSLYLSSTDTESKSSC